jgi:hypothetical protein
MNITGRIFDIHIINDKSAQIVLKKKLGDKIVPVAIEVFGYWKDKALNELKLKPKDKIRGNFYLKSKLYKGKYYTDIFFKEIMKIEEYAPTRLKTMRKTTNDPHLFQTEHGLIDFETGEIIENK